MIGTTYKRKRNAPADLPASVRVVGQLGSDWTVTDAGGFGPTFRIAPADLARYYGAPPETPTEVDEIALRAPSPDALRQAMAGYRSADVPSDAPGPGAADSPETVFARAAREQADAEQ